MQNKPCLGCESRFSGCHTICDDYSAYKQHKSETNFMVFKGSARIKVTASHITGGNNVLKSHKR